LKKLTDWQLTADRAASLKAPIVLMVDQEDCPYCRRVESEFFSAIFAGGEYENRVIFGKISIDEGEMIVSAEGRVSTRDFLRGYDASFTPTVLFLDADKNQLIEKMVGLTTPDYYGFYLEKAIRAAIEKVGV